MKEFIIEFGKRLLAPTPGFFKKMQVIGVAVAACGASLNNISGAPVKVAAAGGTMIWVGGAIVAVAKCAIVSLDDIK